MHAKTLAILALATTAVAGLTACANETAVYAAGFDRSRGAALVDDGQGEEVVWTGMDQNTLCAVDLANAEVVEDVTVYDTERPDAAVDVLDADPTSVLVVDGGDLAVVDVDTLDAIPVSPGVEVQGDVADGHIDGGQLAVVYDDCTLLVSDTARMDLGLEQGCADARIFDIGDALRVFASGHVFAVGPDGLTKLGAVDAFGSAPKVGLWLSATDATVTATTLAGETAWTADLELTVTDVFGFGDEVGVRYADGRVITLDPTSGAPTGFDVHVATGGTMQGSSNGRMLVLEHDGLFVFDVR